MQSFTTDAKHGGVIFIWGDADSEFPICRIRRPSREDLQCSNQVPASIPALLQQENQMGHHELQQKHTKLQIVVLNIQIVSWQISWILASTVGILHSEMPRSFDRFVNNKSNHQSYLHNRPINFVLETKRNIIHLILYLSVGFDPFSLYGLTRTRASQT